MTTMTQQHPSTQKHPKYNKKPQLSSSLIPLKPRINDIHDSVTPLT